MQEGQKFWSNSFFVERCYSDNLAQTSALQAFLNQAFCNIQDNAIPEFFQGKNDLRAFKILFYQSFQVRITHCLHLNKYGLVIFNVDLFPFVDWFSAQQNDFHTNIEAMEKEELNECLCKIYI